MRILLNRCYGGFGFSDEFIEFLKSHGITKHNGLDVRTDERIIDLAMEFGLEKASGPRAKLKIREIPPFYEYEVDEYDGQEFLKLEFPWRALALSYIHNNLDDPVRKAVEDGTLKIPSYP
jgi:hypothetical protein